MRASPSLHGGKSKRLAKFRAVITLVCCLFSVNASATEKPPIDYWCPKYEGGFYFTDIYVPKSFGNEFPAPEFPPRTRTGYSSPYLTNCSTKKMFCLAERVESKAPNADVFVYALPKHVTVGDTYEMGGAVFHVYESAKFPGHKQWVVVVAGIGDASHRLRYKMYVEQGVGIRDFYFEKLRGSPPGSNDISREYSGVSCTLMSKKGLFSGVRVRSLLGSKSILILTKEPKWAVVNRGTPSDSYHQHPRSA